MNTSGRATVIVTVMVIWGVGGVAAPRPCFAAGRADELAAESAYQEGKRLLSAKDFPRALDALGRSQKLDPAVGTLLLIGECYEGLGRLVDARVAFTRARDEARASKKPKSERRASERIESLDARIPELRIALVDPSEGAVVSLDGARVDPAGALSVDAGDHTVEVTDRETSWKGSVRLAEGERRTFDIPRLAKPVPVESGGVVPPPLVSVPVKAMPAPAVPIEPAPARSLRGPLGLGATGLGAFALGIGIGFGASALGQKSAAADQCPDRFACRTQSDADRWTRAADAGSLSTAFVVAGVILVVGGGILWLTSSAPPTRQSRLGFGSTF